jgi:CarboxypepD_reg-like domain
MSKKLQLSIPTPCHEDWEAMTPVEKGKFCGSCQKQVIDFSNMNDRQVAEFFKKPATSSVCGRFMADQLERELDIPKKRIPWLKYFFQFAVPAFLVSLKASATIVQKTQGTVTIIKLNKDTTKFPPVLKNSLPVCNEPIVGDTIITPVNYPVENIKGEISIIPGYQRKRIIVGKVLDETGSPLPGVLIRIKEGDEGVSADNYGSFNLNAKKGDVLQVTGVGLELTEATIVNEDNIIVIAKRLVLGEVNINKTRVIKKLNQIKIISASLENPEVNGFKLFPNPVTSGTNLNIEWNQTEEGYYTLQLLNQSGQSVFQKEIWLDADARLLNIDIPFVPAGSYFISLTSRKLSYNKQG